MYATPINSAKLCPDRPSSRNHVSSPAASPPHPLLQLRMPTWNPPKSTNSADRLKESNEEGGESLKTISLAISILAVLVAMVTVLGHRSHTDAILMQSRAADQWNQYQAKKIRMDNLHRHRRSSSQPTHPQYRCHRARTPSTRPTSTSGSTNWPKKRQAPTNSKPKSSTPKARAARYDLGEALLQIAVVLSSVTLFTRNRTYFLLGLCHRRWRPRHRRLRASSSTKPRPHL